MKFYFKRLGLPGQILLGAAFLLNAAAWGLIFWKLPETADTVLLHYNIYFGVDLAGSWQELLWMPGSGLAVLLINVIVMLLSKHLDRLIIIAGSIITLFLEIMVLLATVLVILLNS
ncbi:hypothetical protein ACFL2M_02085 [Patescibacteria group bacterium]